MLRWAALEGSVIGGEGLEGVWKGRMKICRPEDRAHDQILTIMTEIGSIAPSVLKVVVSNVDAHTIQAVTMPSVVNHTLV